MERKTPTRVFVRKEDIDDFRVLLQEKDSPLYKKDNKDVFLMAMIFGFCNKQKLLLEQKEEFVRIEYFSLEDNSLIKAIAIHDHPDGLKVLLDKQKVYAIAEEYATGGISYLKESVFDSRFGSYIKKIESELVEAFEKLEIDN